MNDLDKLKTLPIDTFGFVSEHYITKKCACCGEKFTYLSGQVKYMYSGLQFCNWNCKQKYRKMHYDPTEEMTKSEMEMERYYDKKEKCKKRYKNL